MKRGRPGSDKGAGFTLIEMAVTLLILTLLIGRFALPMAAEREARTSKLAAEEMLAIRAALLGFAALRGVLPCPDVTGDGLASASCDGASAEGGLPFVTLGLAEGRDPWGRPWRYRVDRHFANPGAPIRLDTDFSDPMQVQNRHGEKLTTAEEAPVFVLMSLGANGRADGKNAVQDGQYQYGAPDREFDDQVLWLSRPTLFFHLLAAGRGKQ
ncbi:MAG: prepilin-type N-terminal cleavage/methylation domain-containing protein [Zoogloeaceae bacterium]|jgi:prepilin-type N-terminal cleavage/methylation domain-containing protein|nr:prepilin-type N-terminal cleavage/methylation domain-containing protein [Zoogloeaceae bacterium]